MSHQFSALRLSSLLGNEVKQSVALCFDWVTDSLSGFSSLGLHNQSQYKAVVVLEQVGTCQLTELLQQLRGLLPPTLFL